MLVEEEEADEESEEEEEVSTHIGGTESLTDHFNMANGSSEDDN